MQEQELLTEQDAAVSDWMAKNGWPVDERHYDFSRELHAWRSHGVKPIVTVWVTRSVVEDWPAELTSILDGLNTRSALSQNPKMYTVIRRSKLGPPELFQDTELP